MSFVRIKPPKTEGPWKPTPYFFYGSLMVPSVLQKVIWTPENNYDPVQYRKGSINGFKSKMWSRSVFISTNSCVALTVSDIQLWSKGMPILSLTDRSMSLKLSTRPSVFRSMRQITIPGVIALSSLRMEVSLTRLESSFGRVIQTVRTFGMAIFA